MKNIIIDGQTLQTDAWYRGMGKYTVQVLRELSENIPDDTRLTILFNELLDCDETRFETLQFLCPNIRQQRYKLPIPSDKSASPEGYVKALSEKISQDYGGADNHFLVTSLFQFDFFAEFPEGCQKLMVFYDLTPLLFWQDLGGYFPPELYMKRFRQILEADHIFSISETTKNDLVETFGLTKGQITNINGGFTKITQTTKKPDSFKVPNQYVLLPTGDLPHKNNEIAVKGLEQYCVDSKTHMPLLITSRFADASKQHLLSISKNIIFTGNITDEELEWLYENAEAVLFASKYEGLGMPVLDAVASKKPIVASRIPVFEEMSKQDAFYYFDVDDYEGLATSIAAAISRKHFKQKTEQYPAILEKYTWSNTCQGILTYVNSSTVSSPQDQPKPAPKQRLAIVCLHPGISGQIGRLAEAIYHSLSERFEVDYFLDANGYHYREMPRPTFLDFLDCKVYDISHLTLRSYTKYDRVLYLLDDAVIPSRAAQRACVLPGEALIKFDKQYTDKRREMFKDIVMDSQYVAGELKNYTYSSNLDTLDKLIKQLALPKQKASPAEKIIRSGGPNSAIIRKLIASKASHDT